VSTGLQVMTAMFDGTEAGSVTVGGRRLAVTRPRVRAADGSGELHLASYDLFSSTEILGQLALEKMLAGLSSRCYARGLEPAGQAVEARLFRRAGRRSPAGSWPRPRPRWPS
jgi:putative transposase